MLAPFPEHNGNEDVYIAVTLSPLHWCIVWYLYEGTDNPTTFNKVSARRIGYKVLEAREIDGVLVYRCSFRDLFGSGGTYLLTYSHTLYLIGWYPLPC